MTTVTFGKHKGSDVSDLPTDYLEWGVDKLDSAKWRKEFEDELKRRKDESKKREAFIKQNIDSDEVWQMLIREAEKELEPDDDEDDYRIVRQSDIEALAREKLQTYQAQVELKKLDADFMKRWGVDKNIIDKIQNAFWNDELSPDNFKKEGSYEAACKFVQKRSELLEKTYSFDL